MPKLPLSPVPELENDTGAPPPGSSSSCDGSQSSDGSGSPDSAGGRKVGKARPQARLEEQASLRYFVEPQESESCHAENTEDDSEEEGCEEESKEHLDSEEEWDTDLETEDSKKVYDPSGKAKYLHICQTHGVTPVSYFIRHMKDSELSLMHHGLGPKGAKAVALSLASNTSVVKLNLCDSWLNEDGTVAVAEMLKENCYISDIDLSENRLGVKGAKALSSMLQENTTLVMLKLSGNELSDQAAKYLAGALLTNNKLESLDMSHNNFGESAGEVLGAAIAENAGMKELNLSSNCLRGQGAVAVAKGNFMEINKNISVELVQKNFVAARASWVSSFSCTLNGTPDFSLKANIFLRVVDLSYNGFGNKGAAALGEALKINNVLEELNVGNNRISLEGALCLALGLKENKTLKSLSVARNPIQSEGCIRILKAVQTNPGAVLEVLDFSEIVLKQDFTGLCDAVQEIFPGLQIKHDGTRPLFRTVQSKV